MKEPLAFKIVNFLPLRQIMSWLWRRRAKLLPAYSFRPFVLYMNGFFGNKKIIGVEIGVAHGIFSRMLLLKLNIEKLYLIDPYFSWSPLKSMQIKKKAQKNLRKFYNKEFIQRTSEDAARLFKKESLDFVYIDGDHNYEFVKKDIKLYWPKIKKGGILGGHDITAGFPGVCRAVFEFIQKEKLTLYTERNEWWIFK